MEFPKRVYTIEEVKTARELIKKGYKHILRAEGSAEFKEKTQKVLQLVKNAGYYEFLRTYIRQITEIDGLTQLRENEAVIWVNKFTIENPVDAASLLIQKAYHMKEYLEGKIYFGGNAEKRSVGKRIEFLETLNNKTKDENVRKECKRLLQMWEDSSLAY